jgi:hypothetical protein
MTVPGGGESGARIRDAAGAAHAARKKKQRPILLSRKIREFFFLPSGDLRPAVAQSGCSIQS